MSATAPITGHEREPCFHFVAQYPGSDSTRWELHEPKARERYSPPYIDTLTEIAAQFAMFKRGDSALVVVAYADKMNTRAVMGVTMPEPEFDPSNVITSANTLSRHVMYTTTPWRGIAVGIEQFDETKRHVSQHRSWLSPPRRNGNAPQLSSILLFAAESADTVNGTEPSPKTADTIAGDSSRFSLDTADTLSQSSPPDITEDTTSDILTLVAATRSALTNNELRGSRKLGLYWEMYGTSADSTTNALPVFITVRRTDGGFGRWLAQALRFTPRIEPIGVGWKEAAGTTGVLYKSIVLDLSQLPRGNYHVAIEVGEGENRSVTTREFRLR